MITRVVHGKPEDHYSNHVGSYITSLLELRHRADAGSEQLSHDASRRTEILDRKNDPTLNPKP